MIGFVKTNLLCSKVSSKVNPDFELTIFNKIADLPLADITLFNNTILLSKHYLHSIEQHVNSVISPVYLKIKDKARDKTFLLYAQLYAFDTKHFAALNKKGQDNQYFHKELINNILLKALNCLQCKVLVLGNMYYSGSVQPLPLDIIEALNSQLKTELNVDCVVIKDMEKPLQNSQKKYYRIPVQPAMNLVLQENWKSFDDYVASLLPKYRKRWNNTNNKNNTLAAIVLEGEMLQNMQAKMHALYESVFNKSETTYNKINAGYFSAMKETLRDDYNVIGLFEANELVAFVSFFKKENNIVAEFVGYDLSKNKTLKLYQTLLYQLIDKAIALKATVVEFGRTGLEIKSTLGAQPLSYYSYLRFNNKFIHKQVADIMINLKDEEWVPRSPFK